MKWYKNAPNALKLMLAFGFLAALIAFVGYQGIASCNAVNNMLGSLYERDMAGLDHAMHAVVTLTKVGRSLRQALLETDAQRIEARRGELEGEFNGIDEELGTAEKLVYTEAGRRALAEVRDSQPEYRTLVRNVVSLKTAGQQQAALEEMGRAVRVRERAEAALDGFATIEERRAKETYDESAAVYSSTRRLLAGIAGGSILVALALGWLIAGLISRPLKRSVEVLEAVAKGDMTRTIEIDTTDEVGRMAHSLNAAVEGVRAALLDIREAAGSLAASSQQLAAASEELSSGTQQQAASQEETSTTLQEMSGSVRKNAGNAGEANQLAAGAQQAADKGGEVVRAAVNAMGEINASSRRIADIIATIDEIAFQTNLLALNAAVEAARAGEQGRGFAVVASEVRSLAQRSATAAKEIKALIQDSVRKVENGSELVNQSGRTLGEIVTAVHKVTDIVGEIAAASEEQAAGIDQITRAMLQMDQVTQANSAQTEELSSTAQTLASQAEQMQETVERFQLDDDSPSRANARPRPARRGAGGRSASASLARLAQHTGGSAREEEPAESLSGQWG
jgi:methyl-accepting chemotaxis protein